MSIAATLADADSWIAMFRWGRRLPPDALNLLGVEDGTAPCHAVHHNVFQSLDADAVSRALGTLALGDAKGGHISIDGKTLQGSRRHGAKAPHIVSAFAIGLSALVGDLVVAPERNEITAALARLKGLPLDDAVVMGDAIFCQRQVRQHIKDSRGNGRFAATKFNQNFKMPSPRAS